MFNMDHVEDQLHVKHSPCICKWADQTCVGFDIRPLASAEQFRSAAYPQTSCNIRRTWREHYSSCSVRSTPWLVVSEKIVKDQLIQSQGTQTLSIFSPESGSKLSVPFPATSPIGCEDQFTAMPSNNSTSCSHLSEWNISVIFSNWGMGLRWFATLWYCFFWHFQLASFTIRKHWGKDFKGGVSRRGDRSVQSQFLPLCYFYVTCMLPLCCLQTLLLAELSNQLQHHELKLEHVPGTGEI